MAKATQSKSARDAIIMNSLTVFYRGSRGVETSTLMERTGVSKSTLYEGRPSKEALIRGSLEHPHATWVCWFQNQVNARYETTGGGLEIIADVLRELFENSLLRGSGVIRVLVSTCAFDGHKLEIAGTPRDQLRRFLEQLALKMGFQCPDIAASAALLIIERTATTTLATGDLSELRTAQLLFQCLQCARSVELN